MECCPEAPESEKLAPWQRRLTSIKPQHKHKVKLQLQDRSSASKDLTSHQRPTGSFSIGIVTVGEESRDLG